MTDKEGPRKPKGEDPTAEHNYTRAEIIEWFHLWLTQPNRERSKFTVIVMVVLTVVIAAAAFYSACIFQGQLNEARKATELTEKQWNEQQRPWVGVEQGRIIPIASPEYAWSLALPYPTIWVTVSYSIKNFGTTPAFHERESVKVVPVADRGGYEPTFPDSCLMAETHQAPTDKLEMGHVIFPSTTTDKSLGINIMNDVNKTKDLKGVWIDFCIAYQDSRDTWHHSRYRGRSQSNGPSATFPDHPGWSYVPFTGFNLEAVHAD